MKKSWAFLMLLLGVLLAAGVALSSFQKELGLTRPSAGAKVAVADALEVRRLAELPDNGYRQYSEALRVAIVGYRRLALRNPIDPEVRFLLGRALECYSAAREAWQADVEGEWGAGTYGDPGYWAAAHPDIIEDLAFPASEEPLTLDDVKAACFAAAGRYLDEAVALTTE